MSAATPLAFAIAEPLDHLACLRAGIRFHREPVRTVLPSGSSITLDVLKVKGPPDPQLMAALKAAVEWRVGLLSGGLAQARARVWREWQAAGKPVAVRSGVHPKTKEPWTSSSMPEGWCESCGCAAGVLLSRPDGSTVLRSDLGSSMCALCELARARILSSRQPPEAA